MWTEAILDQSLWPQPLHSISFLTAYTSFILSPLLYQRSGDDDQENSAQDERPCAPRDSLEYL